MSPNGGLKAASPPPQKQNSEHTRGELNGLVYGDVRIGLTLYSSSCSTRDELNLLLGGEKNVRWKKIKKRPQKKCFTKTPHKGVIRGN
jgi:hypothetical protein